MTTEADSVVTANTISGPKGMQTPSLAPNKTCDATCNRSQNKKIAGGGKHTDPKPPFFSSLLAAGLSKYASSVLDRRLAPCRSRAGAILSGRALAPSLKK